MQFTVVITRQPDAPWRAAVAGLPDCTVEAATREEALERIKARLAELPHYVEVVQIDVPPGPSLNGGPPEKSFQEKWPGFGAFKDDPSWGEFFEELDRQRG